MLQSPTPTLQFGIFSRTADWALLHHLLLIMPVAQGDHIGVSAISVAEMVYLIEKKRIPANALNDLHIAIANPEAVLQHVPVDENVAVKMAEIPRQDLPDRVIAATALFYGVPVLSRDRRVRSSTIKTIW